MRRRSWMCGIFGLVVCGCLGTGAPALAQGEPGDTTLNLHGTVVNGATGRPVARALVASQDRRLAAMTDNDGHFAIPVHVPSRPDQAVGGTFGAGGYPLMLTAQKPGYSFPDGPFTLDLDSSVDDTAVQLKLMPSGAVAGVVTAEGVNAPSGVQVSLLRHSVQNGMYRWQIMNGRSTNARGEFRFTGLVPGEYTVVTATWRGAATLPRGVKNALEYPSVFPGDTPSMTSASVLRVRYGETTTTELHLQRTMFYPVTVPVSLEGERRGVIARVQGDMSMGAFNLMYNESDGAVEGRLPDGEYTLQLTSFPANGPQGPVFGGPMRAAPQQSLATVHVHVQGGPVRTAPAVLAPLPEVQVRVQADSTDAASQGQIFANVTLLGADAIGGSYGGSLQPGNGDSFVINNVPPGRYRVEANAGEYVSAVTCGGKDLTVEPLEVGPGGLQQPSELSVGRNGGTISGTVQEAAGQSGGAQRRQRAFLVLLPVSSGARFSQGGAGQDGHFTIGNIAPGEYRLFATGSFLQQLPFREPEMQRAFRSLGVAVTVAAGQKLELDAPLVDTSQIAEAEDTGEGGLEMVSP